MFESILDTTLSFDFSGAMICTLCSLIFGVIIAFAYKMQDKASKNLLVSLTLLPVIVQVVIMLVNGNLGAGVAIMGAFSLIRFRSAPGSSKEIVAVFLAMAIGIATGMGYVAFGGVMTVVICLALVLFAKTNIFGKTGSEKQLKVTIPENLDYSGIFDDIFEKYTASNSLEKVKTTNLGSMYELVYKITERDEKLEKQMIDEIRCRNGNLTIICGKVPANGEVL